MSKSIQKIRPPTALRINSPEWRKKMQPIWEKFRAAKPDRQAEAARRRKDRLAIEATLRARASAALEPLEQERAKSLLLEFLNKV